jgi:hypothetical protein
LGGGILADDIDMPGDGIDKTGDGIDITGDGIDMPGDGTDMPGDGIDMPGDGIDITGDGMDMTGDGTDIVGLVLPGSVLLESNNSSALIVIGLLGEISAALLKAFTFPIFLPSVLREGDIALRIELTRRDTVCDLGEDDIRVE